MVITHNHKVIIIIIVVVTIIVISCNFYSLRMTHLKKRDAEKPFHSLYQTITDNRRCLSWLKYLHIFANCVSLKHKTVQENLVQIKEEAHLTLYVRACVCVCPECL